MSRTDRLALLALTGVLVAHVVLAGFVAVSVPPGEGPDEPSHLAYARWILERGELPTIDPTGVDSERQQAKHPPLYYMAAAGVGALVGGLDVPIQANPYHGFNLDNPDRIPAFVWSADLRAGDVAPLWWIRALSVLAGAVIVAATFALTRALAPERLDAAVLAAALVAFTPQVLFMSAVVNSDALGNALGAVGITALCVYAARGHPGLGVHIGLGLLLGLALLTKTVLLALLPAAALAVILRPGPAPVTLRPGMFPVILRTGPMPPILPRLRDLALVFGVAGAVSGPWFFRNLRLYGDPLALGAWSQAASELARSVPLWREFDHYAARMAASFVGRLGWAGIPLPWWTYALFGGVAVLSLAGWLRRTRRPRRPPVRDTEPRRVPGRRTAVAVAAVYVLGVLTVTLRLAAQTNMVAAQGRYLFPALAPIGAAVAVGWSMLWPRLVRPAAAAVLAAALLAVAAHTAFQVIPVTYRPVDAAATAPSSDSLTLSPAEAPSRSSLATFAAGLSLESVHLVTEGAAVLPSGDSSAIDGTRSADTVILPPGEPVRVMTRWSATDDPEPSALVVFAHLIGPDGEVAARSDTRFFQGRFPPVAWDPGRVYEQPVDLVVNDYAPEGPATLLLGLYREGHPDTRIPVTTQSAEPITAEDGSTSTVASIPPKDGSHRSATAYVAPINPVIASGTGVPGGSQDQSGSQTSAGSPGQSDSETPGGSRDQSGLPDQPASPNTAEFRNGAVLLSAKLAPSQPDTELTVALEWSTAERIEQDWQVFVHLVDPKGELVATADGPPGPYWPTSAWLPGVPVPDTRRLDLTVVTPGTYEVRVGLYDLETGERATVRRPDPSDQDAVTLGVIRVR